MALGFFFFAMATLFIFKDYPEGKTALLTAPFGVIAEGVEVDLFQISVYLMTGYLLPALLGGISGCLIVLILSKVIYFKFPTKWMRRIAIGILYMVGLIILTSGIV